ncbi:MAG: nucleotide sugar dehydrogenase [Alphaproteobacteria bacterium]|nr:nucleotide sugar dehydrogenase [Alphaproteobacteria bacterium]
MWATRLAERVATRAARVSVVGVGYVGLPIARAFASRGFPVTGVERSAVRRASVEDEAFTLVEDLREVEESDVVIMAVPTPVTSDRTPDMGDIDAVVAAVAAQLRPGQLLCGVSTVYPGATQERVLPALTATGLEPDRDFFLAFSPERANPGGGHFDLWNTPRLVGGVGPRSRALAQQILEQITETVVPVTSPRVAELAKLYENSFRLVNLGFVNEFAQLCHRMEEDVGEVLGAAHTKPYGILPFLPGPGVGGHCIPVDPHFLDWAARAKGTSSRFIRLAAEVNGGMPRHVVERCEVWLRSDGVERARVRVVGVSYKRDVPDVRNAPALAILADLSANGHEVDYHDPLVPELQVGGRRLRSTPLEEAPRADLAIIVTDHSVLDPQAILAAAERVFDCRRMLPSDDGAQVRYL